MITKLDISGFKTFEEFTVTLPSFLGILGPNASGKSNLFDAIRLLSHLASTDLRSSLKGLRGEPHELFRRSRSGVSYSSMSFAVEVLLNPTTTDPWGATVNITHSRIRYELCIERRKDARGIERLVVAHEAAIPILSQNDNWQPRGKAPSEGFRSRYLRYARRSPWLTTEAMSSGATFYIHQDGHAGRQRSAEAAEATVLSSITSAEFPHLFALREELRSWRFLQLDPSILRRPSPTTAPDLLEPDASNLPTVLARIKAETGTSLQPKGALADIAADLSLLVPDVIGFDVQEDLKAHEHQIDFSTREGPPFTSRVVSDGTLRILALLTLLHDPKHGGLVCFEEPENGIHPSRLRSLIRRIRELITDPVSDCSEGDGEAPTQMLFSSHSPVVLSSLGEGEAVFADLITVTNPKLQTVEARTRLRKVDRTKQHRLITSDESVTEFEVDRYLSMEEAELP